MTRSALTILFGSHPDRATRFAAVDAAVVFAQGGVRTTRMGAWLSPFQSETAARAALEDAGCAPETIGAFNG